MATENPSATDHLRDMVGSCLMTIPVILPDNEGRPGRTVARALLSREEARDALGVGNSTLYGLMHSGRLRFLRVGGKTMFAAADIATYINEQRGEKNPEMRRTPWSDDPAALKTRIATQAARRAQSQKADAPDASAHADRPRSPPRDLSTTPTAAARRRLSQSGAITPAPGGDVDE